LKFHLQESTLANGLRVLTCALPHTYSVGVGFYLSVGSRYEEDVEAGAAHFIEHMLFKGTGRRPSPQAIAALLEGHGGVFNASTGQETTVVWAKMPRIHLPLALDVLADMLQNSLMEATEVDKERRVILEEIAASQDVPEELVGLVIHEITWPGHPLGRDIAGTPESVSTLSRQALQEFFASHFGPQDTVLSVTGDVEHGQVVEVAAAVLGDWRPTASRGYQPAPQNGAALQVIGVQRPIEQAHFVLHLPGVARSDEDRYALSLLNVILGEGMSSRLFLEIRERLGLAYAVDSYISLLDDAGVIGVYAAVEPNQTRAALAAVLGELARLRDEMVDDEALRVAREYSKGRLMLGLEDTLAVASWFGRQAVLREPIQSVEEIIARIDALTAEDLRRVARRLIRPDGARLAVVGPQDGHEIEKLEELVAGGPLAAIA
jgi:predicted Zn-dependent peptidase